MGKTRVFRSVAAAFLLLALSFASACTRLTGIGSEDTGAQTDERKLPFHSEVKSGGTNGAAKNETSPEIKADTKTEKQPADQVNLQPSATPLAKIADGKNSEALPFHSPSLRSVPSGTLLTVRLQDFLLTNKLEAGKSFTAIVDEPVTSNGDILFPRGTIVHGRVESARTSDIRRNASYVRLILDSIVSGNRDLPLQTASLFARGSTPATTRKLSNQVVLLPKGRRLIFRLATSLDLPPTAPAATVENHLPSAQ